MKKLTKNLTLLGLVCSVFLGCFGLRALAANFSPLTLPVSSEQNTSLAQRLAKREATYKVTLTPADRQRLATACVVSQSALGALKAKDATSADNRRRIYEDLATQLANFVNDLSLQKISLSDLNSAKENYFQAANKYLADAQIYRTALSDAYSMDCAADPLGFKASLSEVRSLRSVLAQDSINIKAAKDQLKSAFNNVQQTIIKQEGTSQ